MAKDRAELSASGSVVPLPPKPSSELLTVDQAAKRLNVEVGYVRRRHAGSSSSVASPT